MRLTIVALALTAAVSASAFADDDDDKGEKKSKMKFWNLTGTDLVDLYLAPAGSTEFGDNQTKNDDNNQAEADERLPLTGVKAGVYDVKIKDKDGRACLVKGVELRDTGPYSFSLEADQLTDCTGGK
ncbi:MAG: hypothetical protein ACRCS9_03470 [Hyphomicrobium sp.]